jgi:hypothetical protein
MMRRILVNHAATVPLERVGDSRAVSLSVLESPSGRPDVELISLEGALQSDRGDDEVLHVSGVRVERKWAFARAWLCSAMEGSAAGS